MLPQPASGCICIRHLLYMLLIALAACRAAIALIRLVCLTACSQRCKCRCQNRLVHSNTQPRIEPRSSMWDYQETANTSVRENSVHVKTGGGHRSAAVSERRNRASARVTPALVGLAIRKIFTDKTGSEQKIRFPTDSSKIKIKIKDFRPESGRRRRGR